MNRKYNDEQIFELHSKGLTDREIAEVLGVKPNNIANKRKSLGLNPNKSIRDTYKLSSEELQILTGTLLGDSTIRYVYNGCKYPNLTFSHCLEQREYFDWLTKKLEILKSSVGEYNSNKIKNGELNRRLVFTGKNMKCLVSIRSIFYPNDVKVIPIQFIKKYFTELSLYCLFMDDGSYDVSTNSYIINTQCFSRQDLEEFIKILKDKFNLEFTIKSDNTLYLRHKSNSIIHRILKEINKCDSMRYKYGECRHKTPLNSKIPVNKDNPVLNLQEIEENAKRLEVMPNEKDEAIKSSTKAGHCSE